MAKVKCKDPLGDLSQAITWRDLGTPEQQNELKRLLKECYSRIPLRLDPAQNPLLRMINTKHLSAAVSLFRRMTDKPEWQALLDATRSELRMYLIERIVIDNYTGNTILHELARIGFCTLLKPILDPETVNIQNESGQTALHIAAEYGRIDDVRMLLDKGALLLADEGGCTPLHSICASKEPSWQIAKLLVEEFNSQTRGGATPNLNAQTIRGWNTALHLAAGNVNATEEFIEELADMNPTKPNAKRCTPFHVAAASTSPNNVMVAMLRTFPEKNRYCSVGDGDLDTPEGCAPPPTPLPPPPPPLLNTCARNGNARAVAMLIQNGADLETDVLHLIVQESVKNPAKIDGLIAVYDAIVANVVPWWSARKRTRCPLPETVEYNAELCQAMMYLTSWTEKAGRNVIELAIDIGAAEMLIEILNTTNVYRKDGPNDNPTELHSEYLIADMINLYPSGVRCIRLWSDEQSDLMETEMYRPKQPYLSRIIGSDKCWQDRSLLKTEPFLKLTQPMLSFAQGLWFCLGIIQLIYMLCFSAFCLPTRCSLAVHFRYNFTDCNLTGSEADTNPSFGLFLIWPLFVIAVAFVWYTGHFFGTCRQRVRNGNSPRTWCGNSGDENHNSLTGRISQFLNEQFRSAILDLLSWILDKFATIAFCISVFVWYYMYTSRGPGVFPRYLETTSMAFLFGWIMTFSLFSGMSKKMHMFSLVLNEILIKDILSNFLPVYMFVIIGFGFAVHTLRQTTLPMDDANSLNTTVFQVFLAGLTFNVDSLINGTDATYYANGGRYGFYRVVYAAFVCLTVIVLLNVLIAMLGDRYSKAKLKAENVWRYSCAKLALPLHDVFHRFRMCRGRFCSLCCCCFGAECRKAAACHCCSGGATNIEGPDDEFVELKDKANWLTVTMTVGVNPRDNVQIARQESREQNKAFRFDSIPSYLGKTPKRVSATLPEP